jgi:pimeloyl-ACP methyl ester carboxylesterase
MVRGGGGEIAVFRRDGDSPDAATALVWAHGWGQSHRNLLPLAGAMPRTTRSYLLDLPGFGVAPPPPGAWGTADYADAVAEWLAGVTGMRRVWVAHSFGCRVGLQLAARHPDLLDGMFLIAAPGLPPHRSLWARARLAARRRAFRTARLFVPEGPARDRLRARFGSADYQQAGALRPVLVKAVTENLSEAARAVRCPVALVYGDGDSETPPDIGQRLTALMPQSRLIVMRGFGHLDVLTDGRHQIAQRLTEFLEQIA